MHIDQLIEFVRQHVFLYDINHIDYKNVGLKNATWEAIGKELQQSGDAVRTKWKTLRDGYTKYKKVAKKSIGSNKRLPQYLWSTQLSFLDDYNTPRHGNAAESPPYNQTTIPISENSQEFCLPESSTNKSPLTTISIERLSRSSKRSNPGNIDNPYTYDKKKKIEYDGIDHLFLSYADTFKKFPLREQAILKLELAKLFSSTELRLLQNNDLQYSSTSSAYSSDWIENACEGFKNDVYLDIKTEQSNLNLES